MNILAIILSITAFVCAFIPIFGMVITILFTILSVIFAVLTSKENKHKEGSVIAVTISVFAIIVCILVNTIYIVNNKKLDDDIDKDRIELLTAYESTGEKVNAGICYLTIKSIETYEDKVEVEVEVSAVDYNTKFSIFDFALSDGTTKNFVVASYTADLDSVEYDLSKNDAKTLKLTFGHKLFDGVNYIVFTNSENGVKIHI